MYLLITPFIALVNSFQSPSGNPAPPLTLSYSDCLPFMPCPWWSVYWFLWLWVMGL